MKRKFVKVMFFGALALSTVTYVGCKDYDDDIDNLQTQIDANKASIAELQNFVKEGKWVTNVEQITDGFKITFNDNKSYSITSGKDATPTTIKIDPVTKNWIVNDNDLGIVQKERKVLMANRALQDLRWQRRRRICTSNFRKWILDGLGC